MNVCQVPVDYALIYAIYVPYSICRHGNKISDKKTFIANTSCKHEIYFKYVLKI